MRPNLVCGLVIAFCLGAVITPADSLELKNGSFIKEGLGWHGYGDQVPGRLLGATVRRR